MDSDEDVVTRFLSLVPSPDMCVSDVIDLCGQANLIPIATEFVVGDRMLRVATAADLICTDSSGNLVLVELKTTRARDADAYFDADDGNCWALPGCRPLRLNNMAMYMLQTLLTKVLIERWGVVINRACVLRVGPSCNAEAFFLPSWFIQEYSGVLMSELEVLRTPKPPRKIRKRRR